MHRHGTLSFTVVKESHVQLRKESFSWSGHYSKHCGKTSFHAACRCCSPICCRCSCTAARWRAADCATPVDCMGPSLVR